jgi:ABC-2 type transport system permease protein
MLPLSIVRKTLREQRWQIAGYGLAMMAMAATAVWLWPSVREQLQDFEIPAAIRAILGANLDLATAAGYLSGRYFSWTVVLLIVYAIMAGTGAIAGEESSGTADLLLSLPVERRDVLLAKTAATACGSGVIVAAGYAGFLVSVPTVNIDVSLADLAVACANMLPITLFFLGLSLWAGSVAPTRASAAGFVTGVTVVTYFVFTLSNGIDALTWMRYGTPFYYYGAGLPIVRGIDWIHVATLTGAAVALTTLAVRSFERRDVTSGGATNLSARNVLRRALAQRSGL